MYAKRYEWRSLINEVLVSNKVDWKWMYDFSLKQGQVSLQRPHHRVLQSP